MTVLTVYGRHRRYGRQIPQKAEIPTICRLCADHTQLPINPTVIGFPTITTIPTITPSKAIAILVENVADHAPTIYDHIGGLRKYATIK